MQLKSSIIKVYFGLVSFISIIILGISLSALITNILKYILISDEEYLASRNYELQMCEKNINIIPNGKDAQQPKNPQEIAQCILEKTKTLLKERKYRLKINIIENISYSLIFFIIFSIHFYNFRKFDNLEKN